MNKFSERLTELRKKRHWSQKETAKRLSISQALLSHYEKGIRECGLDFIIKASEVFNCSADYLLGIIDNCEETNTIPDSDNVSADLKGCPKLISGRTTSLQTLSLLYSITARLGNPKIQNDFNNIIYSDIYLLLRILEGTFFKKDIFNFETVKGIVFAKSENSRSISDFINKVAEMDIDIDMKKDRIVSEYPISSESLFKIVEKIENQLAK